MSESARKVPDDVLRAVSGINGVIMVNFFSLFVVPETGDRATKQFAAIRQIRTSTSNETEFRAAMAEYTAQNPVPIVGLGSDFDGVTLLPKSLEDVSMYPTSMPVCSRDRGPKPISARCSAKTS